eukprot:2031968-Amphidinium_carterae.1
MVIQEEFRVLQASILTTSHPGCCMRLCDHGTTSIVLSLSSARTCVPTSKETELDIPTYFSCGSNHKVKRDPA